MPDVVTLFLVSWDTIGSGIQTLTLKADRGLVVNTLTDRTDPYLTYHMAKAASLDELSKLIDALSF